VAAHGSGKGTGSDSDSRQKHEGQTQTCDQRHTKKGGTRTTRVESDSVWRGWSGQWALQHDRGRRQGRVWIYRKRWRFRQPVFVVRPGRAAKGHRKLAEVRSRPADLGGETGLYNF